MSKAQKQLVIANWKMNPRTIGEAKSLFLAVRKEVVATKATDVVIAPPAPYLAELRKLTSGKRTQLAAQDVYFEKEGAFTGEVSASMLKSLGVSHVIVGHSERRAHGETDDMVAKKVKAVLAFGMTAVVCIGERERDAAGKYLGIVESQLRTSLKDVPRGKLAQVHIAYEPVWAISTTANAHVATPDDVHEMVLFIRKTLMDLYGRAAATSVRVLYGGSVHPKNIADLRSRSEADGYLIGGTSLRAKEFGAVLSSIYGYKFE